VTPPHVQTHAMGVSSKLELSALRSCDYHLHAKFATAFMQVPFSDFYAIVAQVDHVDFLLANSSFRVGCRPRMRYASPPFLNTGLVHSAVGTSVVTRNTACPQTPIPLAARALFILSNDQKILHPEYSGTHESAFDSQYISSHRHEALRHARIPIS
jgi:hypothetical protein